MVCDPRKNALLKDGSKSDRIDARKLAELLRGNLLMSHPAAGMAKTEPIAAIINDLPKTAGERWRCAWKAGILEAQVAMISPWIRKT